MINATKSRMISSTQVDKLNIYKNAYFSFSQAGYTPH